MLNRITGLVLRPSRTPRELPRPQTLGQRARSTLGLQSLGGLMMRSRNRVGASADGDMLRPGRLRVVATAAAGGTGTNSFADGLVNGTIVASVAASALTVAIKTLAGADPSSGDPVHLFTRSATAANGDYTDTAISSALSLTISSGSTMGATNGVAFRLWLVAFLDSGTVRLGLVNLWDSAGLTLMSLDETGTASSTAEGGAGAADSAQVIYTGTAVTSKVYRILGYLEWSSGLATAGTWASAPSKVQLLGPGVKRPGDVVQVAYTKTGAVATTTTTLPWDDTIPQNTEGAEFMNRAITPRSAANLLEISAQLHLANSAPNRIAAALFQDSTASAIATMGVANDSAGFERTLALFWTMLAGTTSSTTFKVRAGAVGAGTTTFNGQASARLYGGTLNSYMRIAEIMA